MIYLLDLNYTLAVSKFGGPIWKSMQTETYRQWLVDLLRGERVFIVTARPAKYRDQTLRRIGIETKWQPEASFFNDTGLTPPMFKRVAFVERIAPQHGADPAGYFGIESNKQTRAMYKALGIQSCPIPEGGMQWEKPPDGSSMPESPPSLTTCSVDLFRNMK